ncbi:hypothetical protein ACHQM5_006687 [Ranunculus cassubicifolius]
MGAEQSKQDQQDDRERQRNENQEESSIGSGTALAVGAAVGSALLGVAWGVSRYRSSSSDDRVDHQNQSSLLEDHSQFQGVTGSDRRFESRSQGGGPFKSSTPNSCMTFTNFNYEPKTTLKIMSYNVWSQEKCELNRRMEAIGELVDEHSPDFICFQEITPAIYKYFSQSSWWESYHCSMSLEEANNKQYFCILLSIFPPVNIIKAPLGYISKVGREISLMETRVWGNKSLVVATSHLKSRYADPSVSNGQYQYRKERIDQAKEALTILNKYPNVIFCGDMNWDENKDGEFPLPVGWVDAWSELRPDEKGFTYDTKTNAMLLGHPRVRKRFDRSLCNLNSFRLDQIEIIGKDAIPDVIYKSKKKELPVLPSDHYGLILTICN